jgi:hypothetical protein
MLCTHKHRSGRSDFVHGKKKNMYHVSLVGFLPELYKIYLSRKDGLTTRSLGELSGLFILPCLVFRSI